jgi:rubredoxin
MAIRQVVEYYCPHCGVNLRGDPIPEKSQEVFGASHYGREIGVEVRGAYDGVLYWECPVCEGTWQRWKEGSSQYEKAIPYMRGGKIVVEIHNYIPPEV